MFRAHCFRTARAVSRFLASLAAALLACSNGSDGPAAGTAPVIAELSLWPDVLAVNQGGGMAFLSYEIVVSDPDADVASCVATVLDASQTQVSQSTLPLENPPGATIGFITGEVPVPTTVLATYTIQLQGFDRGGRGSNLLRRSVSVVAGNPVPMIAALSPESAEGGAPPFTLTVTGTGFVPGSTVRWDGSDLPTAYVTATTLEAQVDSYRLYYTGAAQITVYSPPPGGGTSLPATFVVEPQPPNPTPTVASISPDRVAADSGEFTLTVVGTGFVPASSIRWNSSILSTTYVDATTLRAQVDSYRVLYPGPVGITVYNPPPAGGTSTAATLVVEPPPPNPVPTLTSMSPESVDAGGPAFTLTVTGSGFVSSSRILWNGSYVSTTLVDSTTLRGSIDSWKISTPSTATITVSNPSPGGGTSSARTFTVTRPEQAGVVTLSLTANDLVWDPYQQKIYVSVPSASALNPNTVTVLDPFTGELGASLYVGSEPDRLSLSDDGQFLYVALRGASSVERLTVPDLSPHLSIGQGRDPTYGAYFAGDLAAAPGAPHSVAVSLALTAGTSYGGGLVVFDDGIERPTRATLVSNRLESLQWDTGGALYATSGSYGYDLYTFVVDASGVVMDEDYRNAFSTSGLTIRLDPGTGLVYAEDGRVIDPTNGLLAGTYPVTGYYSRRMVPDSSIGSAFFVTGDSYPSSSTGATITAYDLDQYFATRSLAVPFIGSPLRRIIRWGTDGLAFLTPGNVVLVQGPFVLPISANPNPVPALTSISPESATAGSPNFTLAVSGTGFVPGSTVLWNGSERATTFVTSTALVAYVPATDVAVAGSAEIAVVSPMPGGGNSDVVTFTVNP